MFKRKKMAALYEVYDQSRLDKERGTDIFQREFQPFNTAGVAVIFSIIKHPKTSLIIVAFIFWIFHTIAGQVGLVDVTEEVEDTGAILMIIMFLVFCAIFIWGGLYPTYASARFTPVNKFTVFGDKLGFYNEYSDTWRVCRLDACIGLKHDTEEEALMLYLEAPKGEEPHIETLKSGKKTADLLQLLSTQFGLPPQPPEDAEGGQ